MIDIGSIIEINGNEIKVNSVDIRRESFQGRREYQDLITIEGRVRDGISDISSNSSSDVVNVEGRVRDGISNSSSDLGAYKSRYKDKREKKNIEIVNKDGDLYDNVSELISNLKEGDIVNFKINELNECRKGVVKSIEENEIKVVYVENEEVYEIGIERDIEDEIPI